MKYPIRLPANENLERNIEELLTRPGGRPSQRQVVRFYNKRDTAEQWIKEGKLAVNWTRLSCHRFRGNEARLWLSVIAYNLVNPWRRSGLPKKIRNW